MTHHMTNLTQTYRKVALLVTVSLLFFAGVYAQPTDDHPLAALLHSAPQTPAFEQMQANIVSFVDYRAVEAAAGLSPLNSREDYAALSPEEQLAWQTAMLRVYSGPTSYINLLDQRISDMPPLLGFDFFDVDAAMTYGSAPFTGTLLHSIDGDFRRASVAFALLDRGYERRDVATGSAWGLGGDGMTDIENIEMGDPFGGDVGLSSRVAVLDSHTLANSFIWSIVFIAADANEGNVPSYAADDTYATMVDALTNDLPLLQTVIVSPLAGVNQSTHETLEPLPRYDLAAIADYQDGDTQVHRIVMLYADAGDAARAAVVLPAQIETFDQGWLSTLQFEVVGPFVTPIDDGYLVTLELRAAAPTPESINAGAFQPGLVYGFWTTAVDQGRFFPFAVMPDSD
jgi:hypothetical protein